MSNKTIIKKKKLRSGDQKKTAAARYFFLTIPKFSLSKESIEELLKRKEMHLKQYCISRETHTDKTFHVHIWMWFSKKMEFGLKHFDYLGKHGKLEKVMKSSANVINYICKEDKKPLANFDLQRYNLKKNFEEGILSLYRQGWSFQKIMFTFPDIVSKNKWMSMKKFISEYEDISEKQYMENRKGMKYIDRELIQNALQSNELELFESFEGYQDLIDAINKITSLGYNQNHKDCCLSLIGSASIGKTKLIEDLKKFCPIYQYPEDGWHRDYANNLFYAIVWNEWEYNLHSPETYLRLFEGLGTDLQIKGSKGHKSDRPYILLTSNTSWIEKVKRRFARDPKMYEVNQKALKVRIKEIDFGDRDLTFLSKLFVPK